MNPTPVPLWRQLQLVTGLMLALRRGESASSALPALDPALRPAAQALFYDSLRALGRARHIRAQLAPRTPPPPVDALLCVAIALGWRDGGAPYAAHTLVNQAVEAAKRDPATRPQSGFVNACLRRFLRERDALVARSDTDEPARWNHPRWWIERLRTDHPHGWAPVLRADGQQAPLVLRVNARRASVPQYLDRLQAQGMAARRWGAHGVVLARAVPVSQLPGFADGLVSVQDGAAQLAAPLLLQGHAPATRWRVLDACAAPGGKTAHLLEPADLDPIALDVDPARCGRIHDTLARLGLQADVRAADAARPQDWWDGRPFDRILLDAPCTASGIVRRHPDIPWLRRAEDVERLVAVQARLLAVLWPLLRPGGRLLYATCSVFRAEGSGQIETFLAHNTDALLLPSPGHLLPRDRPNPEALPDNADLDHDGFFYALLEKRPDGHAPDPGLPGAAGVTGPVGAGAGA